MAEKQEKRYVSDNARLMVEWDWEKNKVRGILPDEITCGSSKKVWWLCKQCGHSWEAKPLSRDYGAGCPICGRNKAKETYKKTKLLANSLADVRPDLLDEWDYELNGDLTPGQVTASSGAKVWWRCKKCNQVWQAKIAGRSYGKGCPVCAGQALVPGVNDLATVNPKLALEWDYDSNHFTPQQVSARNNLNVAWVCSVCGHRWRTSISARNRGTGCPQCQKNFQTSLPEQIIYFYVKQAFPDAVNGFAIREDKNHKTVDVFIPSLNLAIEYDGSRWHKNLSRDIEKTEFLRNQGIRLIRIRERDCPVLEDSSFCILVEYNQKSYSYLAEGIMGIFSYINQQHNLAVEMPVDIEVDFYKILSSFEKDKREKSLSFINPALASEWDYQKNRPIKPSHVLATSDRKFWWKCLECGYSWKSTVNDRSNGHGCPGCAGLVVREGVNDLQTMRPELIAEWDYEKNIGLSPNSVAYRGNKKIWWRCHKCGHSWFARVADRSAGVGCPACAGKVAIEGRTDLATINPKLASEWDYEKNGQLTPQMVLGGSNKRVWWNCKSCGHSWNAYIYSRNIYGRGCPECAIQKRKMSKK